MIRKCLIQLITAAMVVILLMQEVVAQCAMCKGQLETHGDNGTSIAVNTGILYLLLLPFLFAGFIGFMFYRKNKQHKAEAAAFEDPFEQ